MKYADQISQCKQIHCKDCGYAWEYDGGTKKKDFNVLIERRKGQVQTVMV